MHITVIEHTISQIYCVYKDMDVKMAVIFMNRKDNLVLRICKNFTNFLGNMICLKRCNIVFIIRIKGKNLWLCESTERDRSSGTCSYWRCDPWKCGRYRCGYCSNKKCRIRQKSRKRWIIHRFFSIQNLWDNPSKEWYLYNFSSFLHLGPFHFSSSGTCANPTPNKKQELSFYA